MPNFRCFSGCCGIYEMYSLNTVPEDEVYGARAFLEGIKRQLRKDSGYTDMVLIVFTDADKIGNGEKWAQFLRGQGYKVDSFKVGASTTSGNDLSCYLWYATLKGPGAVSLVKEYEINGKQQEEHKASTSKSGAIAGTGVSVTRRPSISGAIRTLRGRRLAGKP